MGQKMAATGGKGGSGDDFAVKLTQLKKLYEQELISDEEYAAKKKEILENF